MLDQKLAVSDPNKAWVADITYVATDESWLHLAGIKDLWNRESVGYAMSHRMTQDLVGSVVSGRCSPASRHRAYPSLGSQQPAFFKQPSEADEAVQDKAIDTLQRELLG